MSTPAHSREARGDHAFSHSTETPRCGQVRAMPPEERGALLHFCTGSSRVPAARQPPSFPASQPLPAAAWDTLAWKTLEEERFARNWAVFHPRKRPKV